MKEHTIIVVMANVNVAGETSPMQMSVASRIEANNHPGGVAYATDTITAQKGFYGQDLGWGFNILLCISTQMMGYGLAGIFRKVLVWPCNAILPHLVSTCTKTLQLL